MFIFNMTCSVLMYIIAADLYFFSSNSGDGPITLHLISLALAIGAAAYGSYFFHQALISFLAKVQIKQVFEFPEEEEEEEEEEENV